MNWLIVNELNDDLTQFAVENSLTLVGRSWLQLHPVVVPLIAMYCRLRLILEYFFYCICPKEGG